MAVKFNLAKIYRKKSSAYNGAKESMLAAKDYLKYTVSTQVVEVKRKQCNAISPKQTTKYSAQVVDENIVLSFSGRCAIENI